ncbi:hypothetical protein B0H12DRAFT_1322879 [Mycena haematopus]|nr:hypothetical protein B0H12DRAFT_1322879 [Mycena haematopus]
MEHPVFPQELFDIIIEELANDLETLRSCALVSRSFHSRARVFAHIRVGRLDGKEHTLPNLHELLHGSPSFAARVESVHLSDEGDHSRWMVDPTLQRWRTLDTLLSLLVSLQRIRVTGATWRNATFRQSISLALTRPTLTSLEFTGGISKMPFTLFSHCPSLRSLTLTGVSFENCDTFDAAGAACAKLEKLCLLELDSYALAQITYWISLPAFPLDISCLRSLECTSERAHRVIERLLNASAQSLQRLRLVNYELYFDNPWAGDDTLDLHALVHLHTLSLHIWLRFNMYMGLDQSRNQRILSLDNVLLPPVPLALDLELCTPDPRSAVVLQLTSADRALAALSFITSVNVILRLKLGTPDNQWEHVTDVSNEFVREMPLLAKRLAGRARGGLRVLGPMYVVRVNSYDLDDCVD